MVITTGQCARYAHQEFVLEAHDPHIPVSYLQNVANTVEQMVAQGSHFKPGQTFQVGWMLTLVQAHADGIHLTLAEPDMRSMPIAWVAGITQTLRQMMVQRFMIDSVGLRNEIDLPSSQHAVLACTQFHDADFFMERFETNAKNDTGWFVGCAQAGHNHNDRANLRRLSLYEAFLHQRGIQGFVGFPAGTQVVVTRTDGLEIRRNGHSLQITPGSYLDTWIKKGGKGLPPAAR